MANYIAKWFLMGAPNDTLDQAKAFQKAARENAAMFSLINAIRNEFNEVSNASALDLIGREVSCGKSKKSLIEAFPDWWHRFYEERVDDLDPIKCLVDGVKEQFGQEVAAEIEKGTDPYKKSRLYRGMSACSIASGDLQLGLSCLNLELLIVALNIINLLIELRRRDRRALGH